MPYQLWIKDEAKAELKRMPGHMRQRVRRAIRDLTNEPRPHFSRQLNLSDTDLEVWRLRLEKWRVIYVVDEEWSEIGILAIRKRPPYNYQDLQQMLADL